MLRDSIFFNFFFARISPNHPMCQIFSLKGMGEREWWGFLLAEEKKGIVCPLPVCLVFRLLNTGCREQRRLKQWFNTWLLSHFITVISHPTPIYPQSYLLLLHHPLQNPDLKGWLIQRALVQLPNPLRLKPEDANLHFTNFIKTLKMLDTGN